MHGSAPCHGRCVQGAAPVRVAVKTRRSARRSNGVKTCRSLTAAALLAASLCAQNTLVLPGSHLQREGTAMSNVPFGRSSTVRVQSIYDHLLFTGPVVVTAIAFRPDDGALIQPKQVDFEIRMSTAARSLIATSPDFAQNRGADEVVVLPRQVVSLAGASATTAPAPFLPAIPLTTPFAYDPRNGGLAIEIVVFAQPPGAYPLDVTYVCDSPETPFGPAACTPAGRLPLRVEGATTQILWGRPWLARVFDATPSLPVVLSFGAIESGPWNGLSLPFDLQALGAPGCQVSTDPVLMMFQAAQPDGSATFTFVVPNRPELIGYWLRYQAASFDPAANALGVVTSQAKKAQVCGNEPVARVWVGDLSLATGTLDPGIAPVLQLTVQ